MTVIDPVCGEKVEEKGSDTLRSVLKGRSYYFCGFECKSTFDNNPSKNL